MKKRTGIVLRQVGELTLLVPIGERAVDLNGLVTLNETGAFLWELLDEAHSPEDLARGLSQEFEVEPDQAAVDVKAFLDEMWRIGLLENDTE